MRFVGASIDVDRPAAFHATAYNYLSRAFFWSIRLLKRIRWNQLSLP